MTTQNIKPGYKQSPLGIIPQNRDVYELKDLFDFHKGQGLSKEMIEDNGKNECILYGELYTHYNQVINKVKSKTNSDEGLKSIKGDILIPASTTTSAYDLATAAVINKSNVLLGGDINILRKKESNICGEFFSNYLTFNKKQEISKYGQGITIIHLYAKDFSDMLVHLPPLPEQETIANILGKVDETIEKTQAMIEKLELRNKGLEQKLLKNKNWNYKAIENIATEYSKKNKENKDIIVLSCTKYDGLVPSLEYFGKKIFSDNLTTYKLIPKGYFAYATNHIEEGSIGYQDKHEEAIISPMYTVFKTNDEINDYFLFRVLKTHKYILEYKKRMEGSIDRRGGLRRNVFSKIMVPVPTMEEQNKIMNILDKATEQKNLYKQKLEKLQELKKGLMQQLLTGKVRVKEFRN